MKRLVPTDCLKQIISMLVLLLLTLVSKNKIKLSNIFYLIGLGIVGFAHRRNLPFILIFYTVICLSTIFKNIKFKDINIKINKTVIVTTIIILELTLLIASFNALDLKNFSYGSTNGGEPIELVDYIIENIDYKNKKFYNQFDLGNYLI